MGKIFEDRETGAIYDEERHIFYDEQNEATKNIDSEKAMVLFQNSRMRFGLGAFLADSLVQIESKEKSLEDTGFKFEFDKEFSNSFVNEVKELFNEAYKHLSTYVDTSLIKGKPIKVIRNKDPRALPVTRYKDGTIHISKNDNRDMIVHEFIHLLYGNNKIPFDFINEGMTQAVTEFVSSKMNIDSKIKKLQISKNMREGGLYVPRVDIHYRAYPLLQGPRYIFAANFWQKLEKIHPGFLKKMHRKIYEFLKSDESEYVYAYIRTSAKKRDEKKLKNMLFDIARSIDRDAFEQTLEENPLTSGGPKLPKLSSYYVEYDIGIKQVRIFTLNRNKFGIDIPIPGSPISYRLQNLDTGETSHEYKAKTMKPGVFVIYLEDPRKGSTFLKDTIGKAGRYRVFIRSGEMEDVLEFDW